ncbi:IS6 family transposase [Legionella saoudiensis]|uniref:IS6 family transposase n=1 Tax=Legionella saoudiensis TaxID=1750561 RepID=UPI000731A88C|nr:IS6 family transposase [Legionella saoudiensis]
MLGYTIFDLLEDIYSFFWYQKNKQWAQHVAPLLLFWDRNYFLAFSVLQGLAKERNLIISENDFNQMKDRFNEKKETCLNRRDLTSNLNIQKTKSRIKGTWLYLYIDSNKKVHDFYFSKNDDLAGVNEFFKNSLAPNGLPHQINANLSEKIDMIRNKFDVIKNNPDVDIF